MESRRIVIAKHGGPEVMREETVELGEIPAGHVRIEVTHAGVNWADVMMRMGLYPEAPKPPFTPGYEVVGKVVGKADDVKGFRRGSAIIGGTKFGGYTSLVDVPADKAFARPKALSPEAACALPVQGVTAWAALVGHGRIRAGDKVLVHGGAGGVGLLSVSLAKRHGAEVYATVGSEEKARRLEDEHGVTKAWVRDDDWSRAMRDAGGADIILDAVGGHHLQQSRRCLAPYGKVVSYGLSSAVTGHKRNVIATLGALRQMKMDVVKLMMRNVGVSGLNALALSEQTDLSQALREVATDIVAGRMAAPRIDSTFALADAAEAHKHMQARKNVGKVLLRCD